MLKNLQVSVWAPWAAFAGACAGSLALDLASKQWAWDHLRPPGGPVVLWDPTLELSFAYNRGSAFGVVPQLDAPVLLLIITVLLIGWVIVTARGLGTLGLVGAGIIAGGALGNLHDRFFRVDDLGQHGVVDFIRVNFPWGGSWPNFNVADAALVVGVLLLMWSMRPRGAGASPAGA